MTEPVVIVGAGIAGATTALALRTGGFVGPVTVVGAEPRLPYRRPVVSKDVLLGTIEFEKALVKPESRWREADIDIRTGVTVTGGDIDERTVVLSDGTRLDYGSLVLATGARARTLPGVALGPRIVALRDYADAEGLRAALGGAGSLIVVGAGLIGAEVASAARTLGKDVTVLEAQSGPLSRVVPADVSDHLARVQRDAGIDLRVNVRPVAIRAAAEEVSVDLDDGARLHADLIVIAVGSIPDTALAQALALRVDDGILVDERYRTSAPDVYAVGDCARLPQPLDGGAYRAENWSAAQDQGTALAQVLLGGSPMPTVPWGWSNQFGAVVQFAGWPMAGDDLEVDGSMRSAQSAFLARCTRSGALSAAVGVGRPREIRAVRTELAGRIEGVGVR